MSTKLLIVSATLLAMLVAASAQCPSITTFQPCVKYVTPGQDNGKPTQGDDCCKLVMSLSQDCLCNAAEQKDPVPGSGISIDFGKAISLPKACGRPVPPGTKCGETPVPP